MTIDPKTLPGGTFVECEHGSGPHKVRVCSALGAITRVYVPVPDGMTVEDAETALADADAWVEVANEEAVPNGARIRMEWLANKPSKGRFYAHRDDLPTDPDAELVEKMAETLWSAAWPTIPWLGASEGASNRYRTNARVALAIVREHEASR